jgi:hypothetical protein
MGNERKRLSSIDATPETMTTRSIDAAPTFTSVDRAGGVSPVALPGVRP